MSLSDLTDREAVLEAIEEFDAVGRDEFLAKYGFGTARSYFLLYRGARYDSKAIAGVAHGYQHPTVGPLRSPDFSGGKDTVARRLRELGFEVTTTGYIPRPLKEWALCESKPVSRLRSDQASGDRLLDNWPQRRTSR